MSVRQKQKGISNPLDSTQETYSHAQGQSVTILCKMITMQMSVSSLSTLAGGLGWCVFIKSL